MLVKLKRNWFGPDGSLYRTRDNPHSIPSDWKDQLPKGSDILTKSEEKKVEKEEVKKTPEQQKLTGSS